MKRIKSLIYGIASLFNFNSEASFDKIIKEYPYPNVTNSNRITRSWEKVGKALQESIDEFEKTEKQR